MSSNASMNRQLLDLSKPMDQQLKESIMTAVMVNVEAITNKPEDEVIENENARKFRKLVYVWTLSFFYYFHIYPH